MRTPRLIAGAAAALVSGAAFAAPITYDFTGTGYLIDAATQVTQQENVAFTGTVTIEVVGPTPALAPQWTQAAYGWVNSSFTIEWAGGSFASTPLPDQTGTAQPAYVANGYGGGDAMQNGWYSLGIDGSIWHKKSAYLIRASGDEWLSSLDFIETGLAPQSWWTQNMIDFGEVFQSSVAPFPVYEGFGARIFLDTLTPRTNVPEPSGLALLGLGLLGVGVARFRRA